MRTSIPTIDSFELARSGQRVAGEVAITQLARLAELVQQPHGDLRYDIRGMIDDEGHSAAELHLAAPLILTCQRCNAPLDFELDHTSRFRFVATEEELNALPIEDDEVDALVGSRHTNVHDWIEDEAILSLPLVPRHDQCPLAVPLQSDSGEAEVPRAANPFAVLLALRGDDDERRH